MRNALLTILISLVILVPVRADDWSELIDSYLKVQAALADDSLQGVQEAGGVIEWKAALIGPAAASLQAAAKGVSTAADLEAARRALSKVSEALLSYTASTRTPLREDVRMARCPMLKKVWLQRGDKIRNPYYGKKMPDCGQFEPRSK